jgi:hypothetical protein
MHRSQAANALLDRAQSSLTLFLDEDDWLLPEQIEKLVLGLAQSPQSVMAYTDTRCARVDDQKQETVVREYVQLHQAEHLMLENYIPIHDAVFRRTFTTQACRFDPSLDLFEDWDFWLQLQQAGPLFTNPAAVRLTASVPNPGQALNLKTLTWPYKPFNNCYKSGGSAGHPNNC